jgi:multisubunit Na+/H+ antiporter MnhF subunit
VILATFVILTAAAAGFGYRLWVGPSLADRAIALNGLVLVGMGAIAAHSIQTHDGAFLPTLVALALVGSISTGMVARFIENGGHDG